MVRKPGVRSEDAGASKRVWALLVDDVHWASDSLREFGVSVRSGIEPVTGVVKLQPFEVITAAVFARLRPDYEWWVTPNRPDGGIDFVGRGVFLKSDELGIDAAITIGGQCKKRERVNDLVGELSGSFARMSTILDPTFFVAAFSANLTRKRVVEARRILERTHQRHCHILDRDQIESLIASNLEVVRPMVAKIYPCSVADFLLGYFENKNQAPPELSLEVLAPSSILAGETFRITIQVTRNSTSEREFRMRWTPGEGPGLDTALVTPLEAESKDGVLLDFQTAGSDDPFTVRQDLEFILYAVGERPLGHVSIHSIQQSAEALAFFSLPCIRVIENLRPRFFEEPYRVALDEVNRGLHRTSAGRVVSVAVLGAGGSGKSRLCEEVGIEARRNGAQLISARQAHSVEIPRRILANLLLELVDSPVGITSPAERVTSSLRRLESNLASRAQPVIEALFGGGGRGGSEDDDQTILSVLAVLIAQRARFQTVLVHLHDLHWCTFDVLEIVDRLIWQLSQLRFNPLSGGTSSGLHVLFLLEGRTHEYREASETGWSTRVFESFIERLDCPKAICRSFRPKESRAFARRLFEQMYSASRLVPESLLELQEELIAGVHRAAGGNPFHMLEHVKLLLQHSILGQNPQTGLLYMIRPDFRNVHLSKTVFDAIAARWRYYWEHNRKLAVLLWSASMVEDNLPEQLFHHLWSRLAPSVTQTEIESTEFLSQSRRIGEGSSVSFRHENYFQAMRRLQVPDKERQAVLDAHLEWFSGSRRLPPALRFAQARVSLAAIRPDRRKIRRLLQTAHRAALKQGDRSLASRILATLLDGITWPMHAESPLTAVALERACAEETELCEHLVRSGQPDFALDRIHRVLIVIDSRFEFPPVGISSAVGAVLRYRFLLLSMEAGILFHDRRPQEAVRITNRTVRDLDTILSRVGSNERKNWNRVVLEVAVAGCAEPPDSGGRARNGVMRAVIDQNRGSMNRESSAEF